MNKSDKALEYLDALIKQGEEFPDAFFRTTEKFNLSIIAQKKLKKRYDCS